MSHAGSLALASALVLAASARAQLTEVYHSTLPGLAFRTAAQAGTGEFYVAGGQLSTGGSGYDPTLVRIEADGSIAWSRSWSVVTNGAVSAEAVGLAPSGNAIWVAAANEFPHGVRMLCWDTAGNLQWAGDSFVTDMTGSVVARRVVFDPAGNGYVLGRRAPTPPELGSDLVLLSWAPTGAFRFARTISGDPNDSDTGVDFATDAAGNVCLVGILNGGGTAGYGQMLVAKVDPNDNLLWTRTFSGTAGLHGRGLGLDASGNVFVCANSGLLNEIVTYKLDPAGNTLWSQFHPNGVQTEVSDLVVDASGGVVVLASETPGPTGLTQPILVSYDAAGILRWTRAWSSPVAQDFLAQSIGIGAGGTIEFDVLWSTAPQGSSFAGLVRYDADGTLRGSLLSVLPGNGNRSFAASTPQGDVVFAANRTLLTGAVLTHALRARDTWSLGCPGDGSGAACPCASATATAHGCPNSAFAGGALLRATGFPSVGADTFQLVAEAMTGASSVFFQGSDALAPAIVDDGLGCVGGSIVRLGTKAVAAGTSAYPAPGDTSISVRGAIPPAGATRHYQVFYRNAAASFCPPATSNRTNSVAVVWGS
ncbi:MAG: hypothetical protein IPJ77_08150 [Planctomycetes bacterium]|nr:hypothetical protein [Planctomycetota bacterium]